MKIFKSLILAAGCSMMAAGLTSCDDFLTKTPPAEITVEGFWATELNAKSWLAGTYHELQSALGQNMFLWGEARSDNFYPTTYNNSGLVFNALLASDSYSNWTNLYRVIGSCNAGLMNVDRVTFASPETAKSYKGQWYGLRAMMYFYAIRVWGDVPLITVQWDGDVNTKFSDRTPVEKVREQIEQDIDMAIEMLDNEGIYYFNKGAALALKADVAMWFHDYQGCVDAVDELMATKRYFLCSDATAWKKAMTTPAAGDGESIFNLFWDYEVSSNHPYGDNLGLRDKQAHYGMSNSCFQNMLNDKNDVRFWASVDTAAYYTSSTNNKITIAKGVSRVTYNSGLFAKMCKWLEIEKIDNQAVIFKAWNPGFEGKLPLYRTADVLLLKAEALNMLDRPQEALDIVNSMRARCGNSNVAVLADYPRKSGYDVEMIPDPNIPGGYAERVSRERLILDERQVELFGEGKRWFDLRRTGYVCEALDEQMKMMQESKGYDILGFEIDATNGGLGRLLFPIHNSVFSANPNMIGKQNEPYSE